MKLNLKECFGIILFICMFLTWFRLLFGFEWLRSAEFQSLCSGIVRGFVYWTPNKDNEFYVAGWACGVFVKGVFIWFSIILMLSVIGSYYDKKMCYLRQCKKNQLK